ncbi:MAG: response regulator [Actinomycetota bacterium]|nr:response regulator [Actinomycetota bacterium]
MEVLRRLTAGNGRRIAVILLTAIAEEKRSIRGLALGADDYVAKPFSARELVSRHGGAASQFFG